MNMSHFSMIWNPLRAESVSIYFIWLWMTSRETVLSMWLLNMGGLTWGSVLNTMIDFPMPSPPLVTVWVNPGHYTLLTSDRLRRQRQTHPCQWDLNGNLQGPLGRCSHSYEEGTGRDGPILLPLPAVSDVTATAILWPKGPRLVMKWLLGVAECRDGKNQCSWLEDIIILWMEGPTPSPAALDSVS